VRAPRRVRVPYRPPETLNRQWGAMRPVKKCKRCNQTFEIKKPSKSGQLFCSLKCRPGPCVPIEIRFWSKIRKEEGDGCWWWTGSNTKGYGAIGFGRKVVKATHIAWFFETGKWPEDYVLHKCDNPSCVRFSHLYVGTQLDNMRDCVKRGRARPRAGADNGRAKLTAVQVTDIRRQFAAGGISKAALGREYLVTSTTIAGIISRRLWS